MTIVLRNGVRQNNQSPYINDVLSVTFKTYLNAPPLVHVHFAWASLDDIEIPLNWIEKIIE